MDPTRFTNPSGELVEIPGGERAFVPGPLPDATTFEIDASLWPRIASVREGAGRLAGLQAGASSPVHPGILERALGRREAVHSSNIEGTVVSPEAIALYDTRPDEPEDKLDPANDLREVKNLREAIALGETLAPDGVFTPAHLDELHGSLFEGVRRVRFAPGRIRDAQVYLGTSRRFVPPPAERVSGLLERWSAWCAESASLEPSVRALLAHYQLETIHPFFDGNGRVGRVVLAVQLSRWLGLSRAWIAPSAPIERHKEAYVRRLFDVSAESDLTGWLAFGLDRVSEACAESFGILRDLLDQGRLWEETVLGAEMKPRTLELVRHLIGSPVVDATRAAEVMGCAYNTARADLDKLRELGIVIESKAGDRTVYTAAAVMRIVHGR